jgi:rhodanese-related sulfurtransferase
MTAFGEGVERTKVSVDGGSYVDVTPVQLASMLKDKDFFLVNTHIPYAGEIAGTDAFLRYDRTAGLLERYPAQKSAKIVLYCRSGRMSEIAARELVKAGFTNVINLSGGMIAWEKAGFSLKDDPAGRE